MEPHRPTAEKAAVEKDTTNIDVAVMDAADMEIAQVPSTKKNKGRADKRPARRYHIQKWDAECHAKGW
jgi:hypothetical protein